MSLNIVRGDAYVDERSLLVTVIDEAGARVDLTGTELRFMVKSRKDDTDAHALISKSTSDGITLATQTGDTKGQAAIALGSSDTEVAPGVWYYELEGDDSIGIITLAAGRFRVVADLIQDA